MPRSRGFSCVAPQGVLFQGGLQAPSGWRGAVCASAAAAARIHSNWVCRRLSVWTGRPRGAAGSRFPGQSLAPLCFPGHGEHDEHLLNYPKQARRHCGAVGGGRSSRTGLSVDGRPSTGFSAADRWTDARQEESVGAGFAADPVASPCAPSPAVARLCRAPVFSPHRLGSCLLRPVPRSQR